ncbi:MAG: HU family DNA-binding protein [Pseudomonadota bacterium]|nr:HU family DNA-binding protein [Pseudomonadota bacterium]
MRAEKMKTEKGKKKKQTAGLSKRDLHLAIAERTGLSKKRVTEVFAALEDIVADQMNTEGPGEFTLPGLAKFKTVTRPAVKARRGINPFTGEETVFAARPESRTVKIRALKKLKGFANS